MNLTGKTGKGTLIDGWDPDVLDYTIRIGDYEFNGIALGSFGAIIVYQVLRGLAALNSPPVATSDAPAPVSEAPETVRDLPAARAAARSDDLSS